MCYCEYIRHRHLVGIYILESDATKKSPLPLKRKKQAAESQVTCFFTGIWGPFSTRHSFLAWLGAFTSFPTPSSFHDLEMSFLALSIFTLSWKPENGKSWVCVHCGVQPHGLMGTLSVVFDSSELQISGRLLSS